MEDITDDAVNKHAATTHVAQHEAAAKVATITNVTTHTEATQTEHTDEFAISKAKDIHNLNRPELDHSQLIHVTDSTHTAKVTSSRELVVDFAVYDDPVKTPLQQSKHKNFNEEETGLLEAVQFSDRMDFLFIGLSTSTTTTLVNDNDKEAEEDNPIEQEDGEDYDNFIPVQKKRRGRPQK